MANRTSEKKLLAIAFQFPPSLEVGAQACAQILRYLPLYGWEPVVLTIYERYIEQLDKSQAAALPISVTRTRMFPHPLLLYKRLKTKLSIRTGGNSQSGSETPIDEIGTMRRWILSLLMAPDKHTGWIIPAVMAGLRLIRQHQVDHLFSSGPYWTNHLVGLALAHLTGIGWTAHFRDPWSQWQNFKPASALSSQLEAELESMVVCRANAVVCVTEQHTTLMQETYSHLPRSKFITIPNGYDGLEWEYDTGGSLDAARSHNNIFIVTYAGDLYVSRNPLPLFRAVSGLIDSHEIERGKIRIDLVGNCRIAEGFSVEQMAESCGIRECVNIIGPVNRKEALHRIARSDLLLLLAENWTMQIPAKTYEYLRAGRPILALTTKGAAADLLRRTGGAWVVDPADLEGVRQAVRVAYRSWNQGLTPIVADKRMIAEFDRRLLAGRFANVFSTIH